MVGPNSCDVTEMMVIGLGATILKWPQVSGGWIIQSQADQWDTWLCISISVIGNRSWPYYNPLVGGIPQIHDKKPVTNWDDQWACWIGTSWKNGNMPTTPSVDCTTTGWSWEALGLWRMLFGPTKLRDGSKCYFSICSEIIQSTLLW